MVRLYQAPMEQVEEVLGDIDNIIRYKDFRYILQSDAVVVYRPFMRGMFHRGVFSEIMYASNTAHKRLFIYMPGELLHIRRFDHYHMMILTLPPTCSTYTSSPGPSTFNKTSFTLGSIGRSSTFIFRIMATEAALLGVPALSYFPEDYYIDRYLQERGAPLFRCKDEEGCVKALRDALKSGRATPPRLEDPTGLIFEVVKDVVR